MRNKILSGALVVVVVFLAGFLPSYAKVHRLESELREARRESGMAQLRDLAGLTYLQASQRDYGLAASTSRLFFDRAQEAANLAADAGARKPLEDLLLLRDPITAGLAQGDPAILSDLQALFVKTRQVTGIAQGTRPTG